MLVEGVVFYYIYNAIYFCTACLVLISSLSSEINKDVFFQNKLAVYSTIFPLLSLFFLIGFRGYDVGTDTGNYYDLLWNEDVSLEFGSEFLFKFISYIFRYFELSYTYFLLFISFLYFISLHISFYNYSRIYKSNLLILFFSSMSLFFFLSMSINVIRQGLSLVILLVAYSLWVNQKNKFKIYALLIVSICFHATSVIPILIFLICLICYRFKLLNLFILFYFIFIVLSYFNVGFHSLSSVFHYLLADDRRANYFSIDGDGIYEIGFKSQFVIFNTLFLIVFLHVRNLLVSNFLIKQYSILIFYYIFSSIIFFMSFQLPYSDRWGLFSWVVIPFLLSPVFYSPYIKNGIKIHYVIMLVLIYIGFNFYV